MSIDEIREACLKVENIKRDLEDFINDRREKCIQNIVDEPLLFILATPMIVKDDIIDIFDHGLMKLLKKPPSTRGDSGPNVNCCDSFGEGWRPTLYGIKANLHGHQSMEILRNGHVEFNVNLYTEYYKNKESPEGKYRVFLTGEIVEYLVNFFMFIKSFLSYWSIFDPIVISIGLANIKKIGLFKTKKPFHDLHWIKPNFWDNGSVLMLPSIQINYIDNPERTAKIFADRIWNAFGFQQAPFFNEQGKFSLDYIQNEEGF